MQPESKSKYLRTPWRIGGANPHWENEVAGVHCPQLMAAARDIPAQEEPGL